MNENADANWALLENAFPILNGEIHVNKCSETEFLEAVELIKKHDLSSNIQSIALSEIEKLLREKVVPEFWSLFIKPENSHEGFEKFHNRVNFLYDSALEYIPLLEKLNALRELTNVKHLIYGEGNLTAAFKVALRGTLLSQLPIHYKDITEKFYDVALKIYYIDKQSNSETCGGCLNERSSCNCEKIMEIFFETNRRLMDLEIFEPMVGQILTSLIYGHIETYVEQQCKDMFVTSFIEPLQMWLNMVVLSWLGKLYSSTCSDKAIEFVNNCKQKLTNFLYEIYVKVRINQLFNIIIDYPESLPAIEDLYICLPKTDLRPLLSQKLQKSLETRLLHPGVGTTDILTAYIAAIRSLRVLDPSGGLLDIVTQPVHKYLRSREDTVRCVVSSLTEEGPSDLAEELGKPEALHLDESLPNEDDTENWETWTPDPIDVDTTKQTKNRKSSDIISMLVNVYGSKELFVNEYRTLLADRLLSQFTCNTEKEIRYLELLKLRFGETQLHYCEVMLKDIADSKRMNAHLSNDSAFQFNSDYPTSAMILSAQFWPPFKEETLEVPQVVKEQFDAYTKAFETLKGNRTLCWKPHLGNVDLEIEIGQRTVNLSVSPIHATIIMHFQTQNEWIIDDLSKIMKVPSTVLRRKIGFWQSQGFIKESSTDKFVLVEESETQAKIASSEIVCEEEESESAMASSQDQREEELQVFWSYIIGMLTNLDSMPLERIHQMLKMFASQGPTAIECSLQELRTFLDRKVREHKLLLIGGYYRLPKT